MTDQIIIFVLSNWPLGFAAALIWAVTDQIKKRWKAARKVLPLVPLAMGLAWGLTPWAPVPETVAALGSGVRPLYYAFAGFLAVYWRDLWQTWAKHSASGSSSGASA